MDYINHYNFLYNQHKYARVHLRNSGELAGTCWKMWTDFDHILTEYAFLTN